MIKSSAPHNEQSKLSCFCPPLAGVVLSGFGFLMSFYTLHSQFGFPAPPPAAQSREGGPSEARISLLCWPSSGAALCGLHHM
eukprot:1480285-Amphidinium_carterae.1